MLFVRQTRPGNSAARFYLQYDKGTDKDKAKEWSMFRQGSGDLLTESEPLTRVEVEYRRRGSRNPSINPEGRMVRRVCGEGVTEVARTVERRRSSGDEEEVAQAVE